MQFIIRNDFKVSREHEIMTNTSTHSWKIPHVDISSMVFKMIKDHNNNSQSRLSADCLWLIFKVNKTARPINSAEKHHDLRFILHLQSASHILIPKKIYFPSGDIFLACRISIRVRFYLNYFPLN